jgi:hypothetical protein
MYSPFLAALPGLQWVNEGYDSPPSRVEPTKEQLAKLDAARDRTRSIGFEGNALVYYFNNLTHDV